MSSSPPANFDPLAGVYDRLAGIVFGGTLHVAQTQGLENLSADGGDVAIFGGGSGRLLENLLATGNRFRRIYYIEASEKMVTLAMARVRAMESRATEELVQFIVKPAEDWCSQYKGTLDAVITPFFLDCFEGSELKQMIAQIASLLRQGGQWWVTDFVASPKLHHRLLMATMFQFFRFSCGLRSSKLEPYFDLIEENGFRSLEQGEFATSAGPVRCQHFVLSKENSLQV